MLCRRVQGRLKVPRRRTHGHRTCSQRCFRIVKNSPRPCVPFTSESHFDSRAAADFEPVTVCGGDDGLSGASAASCASCGSHLAAGQRYCLGCGERRGALPAAVAQWLSIVPPEPEDADPGERAAASTAAAAVTAAE